eukprot:TRINITY_DN19479_c0_g1_i1.p1 TRINITY_DN19479_c0_g1~~TRINITY_DN19479_c0_g1_i1.p1  ORF type:complete len:322 (+),score=52.91 TRINITY_DN19479_c0_g1_i1:73-1038(+)
MLWRLAQRCWGGVVDVWIRYRLWWQDIADELDRVRDKLADEVIHANTDRNWHRAVMVLQLLWCSHAAYCLNDIVTEYGPIGWSQCVLGYYFCSCLGQFALGPWMNRDFEVAKQLPTSRHRMYALRRIVQSRYFAVNRYLVLLRLALTLCSLVGCAATGTAGPLLRHTLVSAAIWFWCRVRLLRILSGCVPVMRGMSAAAIESYTTQTTFTEADPDGTCLICHCGFEGGDVLRVLPCSHRYHVDCIDTWLQRQAHSCPLCETDIVAMDSETDAAAAAALVAVLAAALDRPVGGGRELAATSGVTLRARPGRPSEPAERHEDW